MIDYDAFNRLVEEIMAQGFNEETAAHFAKLIGDRPIYNEDGTIAVMKGDREIARLKPLAFFESE